MDSKRLAGVLARDLYVLEDENNPRGSRAEHILPSTTLDQVFDDTDPTKKTLREIIADLRQEILTGGRGNIEFPVTSVNGQTGDVMLSKRNMNMGNVDNTHDIDKPLSIPQKNSIMEILAAYDFNVNMEELYHHLNDHNNPHALTLDQLDMNHEVETTIRDIVNDHSSSLNQSAHPDIRNRIATLWKRIDDIDNELDNRLNRIIKSVEDHINDVTESHGEKFATKEDISNKTSSFDKVNNSNYPTTRAVVDYVIDYVAKFRETLPNLLNWIDDISSVERRQNLPVPNEKSYRKAYFVRKGNTNQNEIAICRKNSDDTFSWDYHTIGSYSRFNMNHFIDGPDGFDINTRAIVDEIMYADGGVFGEEVAKHYYNKEEIDNMHLVNRIKIVTGTMDGTIRYYINDDLTTMSDDIKVAGLHRLAYLEWVTENELKDNAVRSKHIIDGAIEERHIQSRTIDLDKFKCGTYGTILGNTTHSERKEIHEIKLVELADYLRPLIGGWPDPNTPGGNPWSDIIMEQIPHPHLMRVNVEHNLMDRSYIKRFKGTISRIPNMRARTLLDMNLIPGPYKLIDAGGTWCYQSDPEEWTMLGGSNITGHTFATVTMTQEGTYFESISIGDRLDAEYDVWIRYAKTDELKEGEFNPI